MVKLKTGKRKDFTASPCKRTKSGKFLETHLPSMFNVNIQAWAKYVTYELLKRYSLLGNQFNTESENKKIEWSLQVWRASILAWSRLFFNLELQILSTKWHISSTFGEDRLDPFSDLGRAKREVKCSKEQMTYLGGSKCKRQSTSFQAIGSVSYFTLTISSTYSYWKR